MIGLTVIAAAAAVLLSGPGDLWTKPREVDPATVLKEMRDSRQDLFMQTRLFEYYSKKPIRIRMRPDTVTAEGELVVLRQEIERLGTVYASVPRRYAGRVSPKAEVVLIGKLSSLGTDAIRLDECRLE